MSEPHNNAHTKAAGAMCGTGVRSENRFSSPYAPPCTNASTKSADEQMMNTTMEAKMASGAVATRETTMANGVMHRVMVRVMGEGTRKPMKTDVQHSQPHTARTTANAVE
jgi:hypothetical protein